MNTHSKRPRGDAGGAPIDKGQKDDDSSDDSSDDELGGGKKGLPPDEPLDKANIAGLLLEDEEDGDLDDDKGGPAAAALAAAQGAALGAALGAAPGAAPGAAQGGAQGGGGGGGGDARGDIDWLALSAKSINEHKAFRLGLGAATEFYSSHRESLLSALTPGSCGWCKQNPR